MKAVYTKVPYQFEVRDVQPREVGIHDVLVKIKACGVCGTDLHTASYEAKDWMPFGHEIAGIVEQVGQGVTCVKPGDRVALESGSFCRECALCKNGRVDLCCDAPNVFGEQSMGYGEYIKVSHECLVHIGDMPFDEATIIEPMGVALDLFYTAGIEVNDDVLVVGLGAIGLMALRFAKIAGARKVYAADRRRNKKRIEIAKMYGADEIIYTDEIDIREYKFDKGEVDKVMVTAPPRAIPPTFEVLKKGGTAAYIGIQYGEGANITFDANYFHFKKLSLKASHAAPALYFPRCIEMMKAGMIDVKPLITHHFKLEETGDAIKYLRDNKGEVIKSIMMND